METVAVDGEDAAPDERWLTPGVGAIGSASLVADLGHEIPTALLAAAGIGIGLVETAEHAAVAALAPSEIRGSAFGLLAATQSFGNLAACAIAGALWTLSSPRIAFLYLAGWMLVGLGGLEFARRDHMARNA